MYIEIIKLFRHCLPDTKRTLHRHTINVHRDNKAVLDIVYLTLRGLSIDIPSMYIEIRKLFRHCLPDTKRTLHRHSINVHRDNKAVLDIVYLTLRGLSIDIPSMYIEIIKLFRHCLPDTKRTLHRHSINVQR